MRLIPIPAKAAHFRLLALPGVSGSSGRAVLKRYLVIPAMILALAVGLAEPSGTEYPVEMSADEVLQLETRLAELGYLSGEPNEIYDAETRLAMESFQQANGLEVTGIADAATLERLSRTDAVSRQDYLTRFANAYAQMTPLEKGSISNDVAVLQKRLKDYGYYFDEADGLFNDATQSAVESFQMVNGLPVTGIADGATLMRLMADSPITWTAFLTEMGAVEGDSGLNVYVLQKRLSRMGYFHGNCSGSFGEQTRMAVEAFQQANELDVTGVADTATWAAIYSSAAVSPRREGVLQIGDYGENIQQMQERLKELGFFDHEVTGSFGYTTETAVRLFQMANGLAGTGEMDTDTLNRLMGASASSTLDIAVQQRFEQVLDSADAEAQARIAEIANGLLGTAFGTDDDELYPGFSFVQYVCVAAGLPVTFPEALIRMVDRQVDAIAWVRAGDIVSFQSTSADAVTIQLTIGAGNGKIICVTDSGGWVVLSYMDQMEGATIYCWDAGAE